MFEETECLSSGRIGNGILEADVSLLDIVSSNQGLVCCFANRGENIVCASSRESEMDVNIIVFSLGCTKSSVSGESPFRVCSKWFWTNILFGINRSSGRKIKGWRQGRRQGFC